MGDLLRTLMAMALLAIVFGLASLVGHILRRKSVCPMCCNTGYVLHRRIIVNAPDGMIFKQVPCVDCQQGRIMAKERLKHAMDEEKSA